MKKILWALAAASFIGGCAVTPEPFKPEETQQRIDRDLQEMFKEQEPIGGPVDLWQALARGLKYNLDHRVKLMENALAQRILDTRNYEMLPELALEAGYDNRNNDSGGTSMSILTGRVSLEPSTSQERNYTTAGLGIVWNVLDFGVSHATAKQKADDVLIARERRRRVMQNIMVDVYKAYWRAVGAQRLLGRTEELLEETRNALERSRKMGENAVQNPEAALTYQKRMLENIRTLSRLREEMILAKSQLAALINIPLSLKYEVAVPPDYQLPPKPGMTLEQLERAALTLQPELREEDYKVRQYVWEVKKAVRRMFPGLELSLGVDYSSNRYLYNQDWYGAGLKVTWNVLNLFTIGPAAKKEAEAHVGLSEHRRMALSMAILTQVWVSQLRYQLAIEDYELADKLHNVTHKLEELKHKASGANLASELDSTLIKAEALGTEMNRELAYAQVHTSMAQLFHAVGMDALPHELMTSPTDFKEYSVEKLAGIIRDFNGSRTEQK